MRGDLVRLAAGICAARCLAGCEPFPVVSEEASPVEAALTDPGPTALELNLLEAQVAKEAGEYEVALDLFRQILADNPTFTTAYVGIGEVYVLQKDYANAEPAYARAARLEPRNFDAQYGHGLALQMLERFVEAVKAYHRALTIRPRSVKANLNLATTYLQLGEPTSALIFAEKAVEMDPAHGPARANLGAAYEMLGRWGDAIAQYDAAVELMDPTPPLLMNLINVLAKEKRYVDARNTAEFLIRLEPSANAYERLGWSSFRLGQYDQSIDAYRKAVEIDGTHWPSLNGVGCNALNTWLLSGGRDAEAASEARRAFRQSLRVNPNQPKVIWLLSQYQLAGE
ncbi:MAG: tetratricopeptide repeat protein [Planctomycetota bacterium]|jgi:tetratricopeptide (TPR) repeat protein